MISTYNVSRPTPRLDISKAPIFIFRSNYYGIRQLIVFNSSISGNSILIVLVLILVLVLSEVM